MKVDDTPYRSIWHDPATDEVRIIDQRWLPHDFRVATLATLDEVATAIRDMWVRGAPLIGATAAWGMAIAMRDDPSDAALDAAWEQLHATRPTAINLRWALERTRARLRRVPADERAALAASLAREIADNTAWHVLAWPEMLGFLEPGQADWMVERDELTVGGTLPVNPSGGFLSFGEATTAQGVLQVCELAWQLRGEAEGHQVPDARVGVSAVLGLGANGASVVMTR